jgi:ketosteroid isomerase-like protein
MHRTLVCLLLAACAFGQTSADDEKTLLNIERAWTEADTKKDLATIDKTLAEDWRGTFPDGKIYTKQAYMDSVKAPDSKRVAAHVENLKVRFFGNIAVITGATVKSIRDGAKESTERDVWTDVFEKRSGHWLCVASQDASTHP